MTTKQPLLFLSFSVNSPLSHILGFWSTQGSLCSLQHQMYGHYDTVNSHLTSLHNFAVQTSLTPLPQLPLP